MQIIKQNENQTLTWTFSEIKIKALDNVVPKFEVYHCETGFEWAAFEILNVFKLN